MDFFPDSIKYQERISPKRDLFYLRTMRILAFVGQSMLLFNAFSLTTPFYIFFYFFTQWGVLISWITFAFCLVSSFLPNETKFQAWIHKAAYVCFECAWVSQCVITIFFWLVLSWMASWLFDKLTTSIIMTELHAFSMCMLAFDFVMNDMRFHKPHMFLSLIPPVLYGILSATIAYTTGVYAYPVLTWKDWMSVVVVIFLIALFVACFYLGRVLGDKKGPRDDEEPDLVIPSDNA